MVNQLSREPGPLHDALEQAGIKQFHAKRFFGRKPSGDRLDQYVGWTDQRSKAFLRGLVQAVDTKKLRSFGAVVDVAAFRSMSEEERRYLTGAIRRIDTGKLRNTGAPNKPYHLAMQRCVRLVVQSVGMRDRVNFFFDRQNVYEQKARDSFADATKYLPPALHRHLGAISFDASAEVLPLQAADLLAYCITAWFRSDHGARPRPRSGEWQYVVDHWATRQGLGISYYDSDELERLCYPRGRQR